MNLVNLGAFIFSVVVLAGPNRSFAQAKAQPPQSAAAVAVPMKRPLKKPIKYDSTIAADVRYYSYNEPGHVTHSGLLYGLWGEYRWNSISIGKGKVESSFLYGSINYEGSLCSITSSSTTCRPYSANTIDLISKSNVFYQYDFDLQWSGLAGLGFRYLSDKGEGRGFYQRTGNWLYIPLVIQYTSYHYAVAVEFDYLFYSIMKTNLSEASSQFDDLVNKVSGGYGLHINYTYVFSPEWKIIGYYELWNLPDSDAQMTGGVSFIEPESSAGSIGVRIGFSF